MNLDSRQIVRENVKGGRGSELGSYHYARHCVFDDERQRLYVSDSYNHRVVVLSVPSLEPLCSFGSEGSSASNLKFPSGVAIDHCTRQLYVADSRNHRLQVFAIDEPDEQMRPSCIRTAGAGRGSDLGQLDFPVCVTVDQTTADEDGPSVFVSDNGNCRIAVFSRRGTPLYTFGTKGMEPGNFRDPQGVAFDPVSRTLFVADTGNDRIQEFSVDGQHVRTIYLTPGSPADISIDQSSGRIFASDWRQHVIQVFDRRGTPLFSFGRKAESGSTSSDAIEFKNPIGMAISRYGRLAVVDYNNHRVVLCSLTSTSVAPLRWRWPVVATLMVTAVCFGLYFRNHLTPPKPPLQVSADGLSL